MTSTGKLLYISENVTDYLGHSMVELLSTGGNIYDVIDPRDHTFVRAHLEFSNTPGHTSKIGTDRTIFCRMNTSRNMRRRNHCADNKMVHIEGRFMLPGQAGVYPWGYESVFVGLCTTSDINIPVLNEMACYNTSMFMTQHGLDMTITYCDSSVLFHLGYDSKELEGCSWYGLIHNEDLQTAADYHQRILQTSTNGNARCMVVLRLLCCDCRDWIAVCITGWLDKDSSTSTSATQTPSITCQNQVIRTDEICMYKSMQNYFESSTKPPASPSSSNSSANMHDYRISQEDASMSWQTDTLSHQEPQGEVMSSWNRHRIPEDQHTSDYETTHTYTNDNLSSCTNLWKTDGTELEWHSIHGTSGVVSDLHIQDVCEGVGTRDIKNVLSSELQYRYSSMSDNNNTEQHKDVLHYSKTFSADKSISERLQPFPALRRAVLKWANRLKIKQECLYVDHAIVDTNIHLVNNNEDDTYKQRWSDPFPSCLYQNYNGNGDTLPSSCASSCQMAEVENFGSFTDSNVSNVLSSGVITAYSADYMGSVSTINCAKYVSEPMRSTSKHTEQQVQIEAYVSPSITRKKPESSLANRHRAPLKVSNGKLDGKVQHYSKTKLSDNYVADSLENAVGQAIGMLSSDQLHLLDEVTSTLICPAPP